MKNTTTVRVGKSFLLWSAVGAVAGWVVADDPRAGATVACAAMAGLVAIVVALSAAGWALIGLAKLSTPTDEPSGP